MSQSLLSVKEVSSFLSVHPKTLYKWTDEGKIPHFKVNGLIRFKKKEIEDWQEENKCKALEYSEILPKLDLSLELYDKMLLKGRSALSKKGSRRWNYGFGAIYIRKTKGGKDRWYIDYREESGKRTQQVVKHALKREDALIELQSKVAQCFAKEHPGRTKPEKVPFPKFAQLYLENYAKANKKSWKDDKCRLQGWTRSAGY